jgi:hypothetical protein
VEADPRQSGLLLVGTQPDPIRQELVTVGSWRSIWLAGWVQSSRSRQREPVWRRCPGVAKELDDGWMRRWWLARRARLGREVSHRDSTFTWCAANFILGGMNPSLAVDDRLYATAQLL